MMVISVAKFKSILHLVTIYNNNSYYEIYCHQFSQSDAFRKRTTYTRTREHH
jgi:hypothetical protein